MSLWCSVTKTAVVDTGQEYTFCVVPQVERSVRHRLWCRHCWAKAYQRQNGETHPFAKRTAFLSSTFVLYAHKEPTYCLRGLFLVLVSLYPCCCLSVLLLLLLLVSVSKVFPLVPPEKGAGEETNEM